MLEMIFSLIKKEKDKYKIDIFLYKDSVGNVKGKTVTHQGK